MRTVISILIQTFLLVKGQEVVPNILVTKSTDFVSEGTQNDFTCRLTDTLETINECKIASPSGNVWKISDGQVLDENSNPVAGYAPADEGEPDKVCGISIASVAGNDLGDWICIITRSGGATATTKAIVNLRTSGYVPDIRLPSNSIPINYDVSMIILLEPDFRIDGEFSIQSQVTRDLVHDGYFTMNAMYMNIDEGSIIVLVNDVSVTVLEHIYDYEREFYTIRYEMPTVEEPFNLIVSGSYKGSIFEAYYDYGVYYDTFMERDTNVTKYVAATQFEHASARWAFPCLDEPNLKATFNLRLGRRETDISLSNMPQKSSGDPIEGYPGYVWDEYDETVVQSTYLVAFAVGDFIGLSEHFPHGLIFSTWARPDHVNDGIAVYSNDVGPKLLEEFGSLFDIPYNLPKQDQIGLPSKGGAMENWGLVTYGEIDLLIDENQATVRDKAWILGIIAHELAHQWFGNLVTMKWWDDIWLNEGFAEYIMYLGADAVDPTQLQSYRFYTEEILRVLERDSRPKSDPIIFPVEHHDQVSFGYITYFKGASIVRMMENMLTRPTFIKGLQEYLTIFSYGNAVTDDLWFELNKAGHQDGTLGIQYEFKDLMDPWLRQKNYPLLSVTRNYDVGTVRLTQQRFLTEEDTSGDQNDYEWYIPLTYTFVEEGQTNFDDTYVKFYLEPNSILNLNLGTSDGPLIFNLQSVGFYRVNYDSENWNRIIDTLNSSLFTSIHPINRAQLLHDAFAVATAGIESFDLPLRVADYLDRETDYVPLSTALYIWKELMVLNNLDVSALALRDSLLETFLNNYAAMGMDFNPDNSFIENYIQGETVESLCLYDVPECVTDAQDRFAQWMAALQPELPENNPINKEVRYPVYCSALLNGYQEEYDFLSLMLKKTINPHEVYYISYALYACTPFKSNLRGVLDNITDHKELLFALEAIADHRQADGAALVLDWIADKCEELNQGIKKIYWKNLAKILRKKDRMFFKKRDALKKLSEKCSQIPYLNEVLQFF